MSGGCGKMVVQIGYTQFVLDVADAIKVLEALAGAERYESKYHPAKDGAPSHHTQHVYAFDDMETITAKVMGADLYRMAKLAGKPSND